jgi:divalent metal cation (Fe/Co/Zn/Cd) transporter
MSITPVQPPTLPPGLVRRDAGWLRAARQARLLAWFSLVWMLGEGIGGLVLGAEADSIGVIAWGIGSAVEGAAAVIVIVRFSGRHRFSPTAERRAQKWVAGSFFVLIPYVVYESLAHLASGVQPEQSWLAVALLASSVVLMPVLGWMKLRLARRLDSDATAGEGTQNLLCALQGFVAMIGLLLGSGAAPFLDPIAALVIVGIAAKEGVDLWRGEDSCCTPLPGAADPEQCDCC